MSCGNSCPCQFKWPLDTQGSKRDPINSEKSWLDFAVRLLSREVVGKARGQETVWSERCKPQWWSAAVGLPWKNPTANPKDSKEVLLKKYTALECRLREEGRFPAELEEEARLWNEGKYRELFLLTSLTSLLGKVTGVHGAVIDACARVEELKARVHESLLTDIKQCLTSTLKAVENFEIKSSKPKPTKRPVICDGKENDLTPPLKYRKTEVVPSQKPALSPKSEVLKAASVLKSQQSSDILDYLQRLLKKRKLQTNSTSLRPNCPPKIQPKPAQETAQTPEIVTLITDLPAAQAQAPTMQSQVTSTPVALSMEEFNSLFQNTSAITCSHSEACILGGNNPVVLADTSPKSSNNASCPVIPDFLSLSPVNDSSVIVTSPTPVQEALVTDAANCITDISDLIPPQTSHQNKQHVVVTDNSGVDFLLESPETENTVDHIRAASVLSSNSHENCTDNASLASNISKEIMGKHTANTASNPFCGGNENHIADVILTDCQIALEDQAISETFPSLSPPSSRTSGRIDSSGSNSGSDSEKSPKLSDAGYCSDSTIVDLDQMFTLEEQNQLWEDDGSFLLDRFLDDLEGPVNDSDQIPHS